MTRHPDHLRFATSAPWFVEFDDAPRISRAAVAYFQKWQSDCELELKKLPKDQLAEFVPAVQEHETSGRIACRKRMPTNQELTPVTN